MTGLSEPPASQRRQAQLVISSSCSLESHNRRDLGSKDTLDRDKMLDSKNLSQSTMQKSDKDGGNTMQAKSQTPRGMPKSITSRRLLSSTTTPRGTARTLHNGEVEKENIRIDSIPFGQNSVRSATSMTLRKVPLSPVRSVLTRSKTAQTIPRSPYTRFSGSQKILGVKASSESPARQELFSQNPAATSLAVSARNIYDESPIVQRSFAESLSSPGGLNLTEIVQTTDSSTNTAIRSVELEHTKTQRIHFPVNSPLPTSEVSCAALFWSVLDKTTVQPNASPSRSLESSDLQSCSNAVSLPSVQTATTATGVCIPKRLVLSQRASTRSFYGDGSPLSEAIYAKKTADEDPFLVNDLNNIGRMDDLIMPIHFRKTTEQDRKCSETAEKNGECFERTTQSCNDEIGDCEEIQQGEFEPTMIVVVEPGGMKDVSYNVNCLDVEPEAQIPMVVSSTPDDSENGSKFTTTTETAPSPPTSELSNPSLPQTPTSTPVNSDNPVTASGNSTAPFPPSFFPQLFDEFAAAYANMGFESTVRTPFKPARNLGAVDLQVERTRRELARLRAGKAGSVLARARVFGQTIWSPSAKVDRSSVCLKTDGQPTNISDPLDPLSPLSSPSPSYYVSANESISDRTPPLTPTFASRAKVEGETETVIGRRVLGCADTTRAITMAQYLWKTKNFLLE